MQVNRVFEQMMNEAFAWQQRREAARRARSERALLRAAEAQLKAFQRRIKLRLSRRLRDNLRGFCFRANEASGWVPECVFSMDDGIEVCLRIAGLRQTDTPQGRLFHAKFGSIVGSLSHPSEGRHNVKPDQNLFFFKRSLMAELKRLRDGLQSGQIRATNL